MKDSTREEILRYRNDRIPAGDFLSRVLTNDLFGAVAYADDDNILDIVEICQFIYNNLPAISHGNILAVHNWLRYPNSSPEGQKKPPW